MNKTEKMRAIVALCNVALIEAKDLAQDLQNERKVLFKALGIEDQDSEKIEDAQLYCIANDLEYNADSLESYAKDLESVIKDLERLKV